MNTKRIVCAIDIDGTLCDSSNAARHLPLLPWGDWDPWRGAIRDGSFNRPGFPAILGAYAGVQALIDAEATILLVTRRDDELRHPTREWVARNFPQLEAHGYGLLMGPAGCFRLPAKMRQAQLAEIAEHFRDARLFWIDDRPNPDLIDLARWLYFTAPQDWPRLVEWLPEGR